MWPWDNNAMATQQELQFMLPQYPYTLTPRDLLDYQYVISQSSTCNDNDRTYGLQILGLLL